MVKVDAFDSDDSVIDIALQIIITVNKNVTFVSIINAISCTTTTAIAAMRHLAVQQRSCKAFGCGKAQQLNHHVGVAVVHSVVETRPPGPATGRLQ